jgi:hypothetical protein
VNHFGLDSILKTAVAGLLSASVYGIVWMMGGIGFPAVAESSFTPFGRAIWTLVKSKLSSFSAGGSSFQRLVKLFWQEKGAATMVGMTPAVGVVVVAGPLLDFVGPAVLVEAVVVGVVVVFTIVDGTDPRLRSS